MLRATKPGVKESELAGIYKGEVAKAGGQVYWMHMAVSRGGNFPAIKDKVLQKGDIFASTWVVPSTAIMRMFANPAVWVQSQRLSIASATKPFKRAY